MSTRGVFNLNFHTERPTQLNKISTKITIKQTQDKTIYSNVFYVAMYICMDVCAQEDTPKTGYFCNFDNILPMTTT